VLAPAKPVVLTAAMRPATALQADGPQNLADAVAVAREGARGVVAVVAGQVHGAADVRKCHSRRLDAFDSGDAGTAGRRRAGPVNALA
jgi:L-asparaginase